MGKDKGEKNLQKVNPGLSLSLGPRRSLPGGSLCRGQHTPWVRLWLGRGQGARGPLWLHSLLSSNVTMDKSLNLANVSLVKGREVWHKD